MTGHFYHHSGLTIWSQIELPEWALFRSAAAAPDVRIVIDRSVTSTNLHDHQPLVAGTELKFDVSGVGIYAVRDGREIRINPEASIDAPEMRLYALGSAWGALCHQRRALVLHASVVQTPRGAVGFCGPSGAGKSTIAAYLADLQHRLISDDLCRFETGEDGRVLVHRSATRLKLWRDALEVFDWQDRIIEPDRFRLEKFHLALPPVPAAEECSPCAPQPLLGLYVLQWGEPAIERIGGLEAVRCLVENATYRFEYMHAIGRFPGFVQQCQMLLGAVPLFRFSRPRDFTALADCTAMLLAHWNSGLLANERPPGS